MYVDTHYLITLITDRFGKGKRIRNNWQSIDLFCFKTSCDVPLTVMSDRSKESIFRLTETTIRIEASASLFKRMVLIHLVLNAKQEFQRLIFIFYIKKKNFPQLKISSNHFSTTEFNKDMKRLGGAIEYNLFSKNIIVSKNFIKEFVSMPSKIFSVSKGQKRTNDLYDIETEHYQHYSIQLRLLGEMFSSKYFDSVLEDEFINFNRFIGMYISNCGVKVSFDTIKIDDFGDLLYYVFFESALYRTFGNNIPNNPNYKTLISSSIHFGSMPIKSEFNVFSRFKQVLSTLFLIVYNTYSYLYKYRRCAFRALYSRRITKLGKILKNEMDSAYLVKSSSKKCTDALSMIILNQKYFHSFDIIATTLSLVKLFECMLIIPLSRILNSIVYISNHTDRLLGLIQEQKTISAKYGESLSSTSLKKMKFLDAFIKESLLLSSPASIRECPFTRFALMQIKLVFVILLRKYYIFSDIDYSNLPQSQYTKITTVFPSTNVIYLKKIN
ncbi:hypothetical protein BB561_004519 [Smittium simulii]|uniref:Uncharacterized protein n=1 Tax=Smittium simulii TaxID=133385 RepID=A0A2T9YFS3_9FUNG|nr:hypothetical protein BB561_004519 [Smittium simulii]